MALDTIIENNKQLQLQGDLEKKQQNNNCNVMLSQKSFQSFMDYGQEYDDVDAEELLKESANCIRDLKVNLNSFLTAE